MILNAVVNLILQLINFKKTFFHLNVALFIIITLLNVWLVPNAKSKKQMAEDLFGTTKELSRADKMRASRKITTDLTKDAMDYLNKSGCFKVWRNNNMPSTRIYKEKEWMEGETEEGNWIKVKVEVTKTAFKSNQTKVSTFDIIGFRIVDGVHLEIEVKTKDQLDEDQAKHLVDLKKAGCISFVISDMFTLKHQIEPFMIRKLPF